MNNGILQALELARYLLGQISSLGQITEIRFAAPDPTIDFNTLPSFGHIPAPSTRWCCALMQPFVATDVKNARDTQHVYGSDSGGNGYIYSSSGGLIDVGHIRDNADMARYCASQVLKLWPIGGTFSLGPDADPQASSAEERIVTIKSSSVPATPGLIALIGARIAYDTSVWHEILTWDNFSSFSPEDNYSNLLGTYVGYLAVLTPGDFNQAVTDNLTRLLTILGSVSKDVTNDILDYVDGHWHDMSSLKRRHFDALVQVPPWQVTEVQIPGKEADLVNLKAKVTGPSHAVPIQVPDSHGIWGDLSQFYEFHVKNGNTTVISNVDFGTRIEAFRNASRQNNPNIDKP